MSNEQGIPQGSDANEAGPADAESHSPTTGAPMSPELIELLRYRIATQYYDHPRVIDCIARAVVKDARM